MLRHGMMTGVQFRPDLKPSVVDVGPRSRICNLDTILNNRHRDQQISSRTVCDSYCDNVPHVPVPVSLTITISCVSCVTIMLSV